MLGRHVSSVFLSINVTFFCVLSILALFYQFDAGTTYVLYGTLVLTFFNVFFALVVIGFLRRYDVRIE